ncbi:MAG: aromatic ring-hydroxylating dioxygenase subunit alpha [Acidimicrobiales bacterium]|nr:aromatic ring-hydroxylating dioxygenase subunit alpha [Acidimicrobiales bacterium]
MTDTEDRPASVEDTYFGSAITASGLLAQAPYRVPRARYTSPDYARLELERMWPKVWNIACGVDHVAEPGDWFEYRLGRYSILIVRGDDGELRAFQNVCRHRGNTICTGSGQSITELRCVYHRWSWDLSGRLREVPSRRGFGKLTNDELPLLPAQVDTWGPFVFVNPDNDAMSLAEWLEGVPDDIAWAKLEEFRCTFTTVTPVPANWKVISEGFSETYHIQGIHREMLGCLDDINSPQRIWDRHSVSYQPYAVPSPRLGRSVDDTVVWKSFIETQGGRMGPDYTMDSPVPPIPEGSTLADVVAQNIRDHQATLGIDLERFGTDQIVGLSQYNLFPNTTVLVSADLCTVLSSRPGPTPDEAFLVAMHFSRTAPGAERARPMDVDVPIEQADFGFVLNQDFGVLKTMQVGLHQPDFHELVLSSEECRIINMHRNLASYVDEPGT